MIGKLIDFNTFTKVGYVVADSKKIFVSAQNFPPEQRNSLASGKAVSFDITHSKRLGLHAVNARLLNSSNKPKRGISIPTS